MIIWIASYPKSGNTWVRSLLSAYLYSNDGVFNFDLLYKIPQFPNQKFFKSFLTDFTDIKNVSDYWIVAQEKINLSYDNDNIILKTHNALCTLENNPFTNKINTKAVIYVIRDPRNIITSISNHFSYNIKESYSFITDKNKFLAGDKLGGGNSAVATPIGSWSDHYNSWSQIKFAPILFIKYENLINNTKDTLIRILTFLQKFMDIKIHDEKILRTIKSCSFENLAEMEKNKGFQESANSKKNEIKKSFFYLGKKNNWKNLLNNQTEEKIRKVFNSEMKELGYI